MDLVSGLEGFEHDRIHLSSTRRAALAAPSILSNEVALRREAGRADLVHAVGDMAAMLSLGALRRRPSVFGTHGLHYLRRAGGPGRAVARRRLASVIDACERTACSSRPELAELQQLTGGSPKLVELLNGMPVPPLPSEEQRAAARFELGLATDGVVVLFLGQLEERKQPLAAVEAAEQAVARGLPLTLLVAGEGPLSAQVAARESPAVRPLGFRSDTGRLLQAADIFVMPSQHEGLSLAVIEALAHALPVVVSDGPGNPEAVGPTGVVFPAGDIPAFTDALCNLAQDPERRRRLGAAARRRAETELSAERFLADMDRLFREVLSEAQE